MTRPTVLLDLASDNRLARDLAVGGVFVPGCTLKLDEDCDLIVRALDHEVCVAARVVFVDPTRGAGLELVQCSPGTKERIAQLAATVGISASTVTDGARSFAAAAARVSARADKLVTPATAGLEARKPTITAVGFAAGPTSGATGDGSAATAARPAPATLAAVTGGPRTAPAPHKAPTPTITGNALAAAAARARASVAAPSPTITGDALAAAATAALDERARRAASSPTPPGPTSEGASQSRGLPRAEVITGPPTTASGEISRAKVVTGGPTPHDPAERGGGIETPRAKVMGGGSTPDDPAERSGGIVTPRARVITGSPQTRSEAVPRGKIVTGPPTMTGDALAAAAAAANAAASDGIPVGRGRDITGPPTITGEALAEAARLASARAEQRRLGASSDPGAGEGRLSAGEYADSRARQSTGSPTITGDALAEAAQRARAAAAPPQDTGAPTITGDALAEAAAAAMAARTARAAAAEPTSAPTITGDALATAAATALAAADGTVETALEVSESRSHASDQDDADEDIEAIRKIPANVHERLRGLTLVQQVKIAMHGEMQERIVLERMYGKQVWEPLLRNPRITGQEVARMARMGTLPRTLIETIVNNGTWLQIPEVRRALLANHRLSPDQVLRILRLLPKHELKLAAIQTAYPIGVRDTARRMMRGD